MNSKVKELEAKLEELDKKRLAVREEAQKVKEQLSEALLEEQAKIWGMSVKQYNETRKPIDDRQKLQSRLHAARTTQVKLERKSVNQKYSNTERKGFRAKLVAEEEKVQKLELELATASQERLSVLLNRQRVKMGLKPRIVQGATIVPLG